MDKHQIFTLVGIMIASIGVVLILILVILQVYHFHKAKLKTLSNFNHFSYITNLLTIFVIILFWLCSCLFLLLYTGLSHQFMSCNTVYAIMPKVVQVAMYSKWTVFLLRIKMCFKNSIYQYSTYKLIILGIIFSMFSITIITVSVIVVHSYEYEINNEWIICTMKIPKWFGILVGGSDVIISFICMFLFIQPLRNITKQQNEIELQKTIENKHSQPSQTGTETSRSGTGTEFSNNNKENYCQRVVRKYTILTTVAGVTSLMFYGMASMTGQGFPSIVDFICNSYSLALMSKWYDSSNNTCYKKLCCAPIRCSNKCC
eukprot:242765_1